MKHLFRHGVHPPDFKELTAGVKIRRMPYPDELVLPLSQHFGKPARLLVRMGDRVERGDMVGAADGFRLGGGSRGGMKPDRRRHPSR